MAKYSILLAILFARGFASPSLKQDGPDFDTDLSIFFDHTVTDAAGRIVGGTAAAEGAYPWMVAMRTGMTQSFLCGGSVITKIHVLSAAHCIDAVVSGNQIISTLRVTVGTNRWNIGGQSYTLRRHINHPRYNGNIIKNDIGVLVTTIDIVMSDLVKTIPLNYGFVPGNIPVRVSGWGRTKAGGPLSDSLLELQMNTVDGLHCMTEVQRVGATLNIRPPPVDPNLEICAFVGVNYGACNGDSGSPLILNSNNEQVGIVSWGLPCARGAPDMFVRVSAYYSWLHGTVRDALSSRFVSI